MVYFVADGCVLELLRVVPRVVRGGVERVCVWRLAVRALRVVRRVLARRRPPALPGVREALPRRLSAARAALAPQRLATGNVFDPSE